VHSIASGVQKVDALFFMLGWDWYGFQKKRAETRYARLVFLHKVGDVGCGPIFLMNMTMGVKITCETLTNSLAVPLLPMQQISTLLIFATPHTCAHSHRPRSSLQSTNSQWNGILHLIFRIEITRLQQSGE
jgi:hypothetical protein